MEWLRPVLEDLIAQPVCGYALDGPPSTEPTALAALALMGHGRGWAAVPGLKFLAKCQQPDGSVSVRLDAETPGWPTSLAVLAWRTSDLERRFESQIKRAVRWMLEAKGKVVTEADGVGHNPLLAAWPWVQGTHGWVEPTALHVVALKAAGHRNHPRTREGVEMLFDRQLPEGGCNYGNTLVLGQVLRPHVQPTGVALLGLAGEKEETGRIDRSVAYLQRELSSETTTSSLAWGLLGLAAHAATPPQAAEYLAAAAGRTRERSRSPCHAALLALAALGDRAPLVSLPLPKVS